MHWSQEQSQQYLPTVATPAPKDKCAWLVDAGSEQDLISVGMLKAANATNRRVSDTADSKPYFIRPDHKVIELNVDGRVPVIDPFCKVISGKQFKKDCKLVKLFAMASRSSDADEAEGVDEGVPTDDEAEYVRSRKTSDLEAEAKSSHHQFCHYPKNAFRKVCQKARMMAPPTKKKGGQKRLETKCFGGPYRC